MTGVQTCALPISGRSTSGLVSLSADKRADPTKTPASDYGEFTRQGFRELSDGSQNPLKRYFVTIRGTWSARSPVGVLRQKTPIFSLQNASRLLVGVGALQFKRRAIF